MSESSDDDPIAQYFARFPSFNYQPSLDWRQLGPFNALAERLKWNDEHRKKEFKKFKRTWTTVVESEFSGSSLHHYQSVCRDLDIFQAKSVPPQTTRARLRGEFIRRAQERRRDFTVDWVHLKLNDQAQRTVLCKDPFRSVDERVEKLIAGM